MKCFCHHQTVCLARPASKSFFFSFARKSVVYFALNRKPNTTHQLQLLPVILLNQKRSFSILRRKKDGDWYIYPEFLAHENFNNVHKKVQKGYKIFKPTIHNVLSTGTNIVIIWLSLSLIRGVRFARYCGKMYSRHLFSYGGLLRPVNPHLGKCLQRLQCPQIYRTATTTNNKQTNKQTTIR